MYYFVAEVSCPGSGTGDVVADSGSDTSTDPDVSGTSSKFKFKPIPHCYYVLSFNSSAANTSVKYRYYVGQVITEGTVASKGVYNVKFMRYCRKASYQFAWPQADDESIMSRQDFVVQLSCPTSGRRGTLIFAGSELGPYMKWMQ